MSQRKIVLIVVTLLLIIILRHSFYLRSIGYDHIPETFVILDERTNVWHGLSIRKSGVPAAWSNLEIYKHGFGGEIDGLNLKISQDRHVTLANFPTYPKPIRVIYELDYGKGLRHTPFVQPYLDHPPLGALVLSSLVSSDVKTFSDLTSTDFRKTSLWLGVASGALIFFLGWQISASLYVGLLAAAIYGYVPTFNLLSRYGLLENVLNPLMLLTLNLLVLAQKMQTLGKSHGLVNLRSVLFLAGLAGGLTALTKITGWSLLVIGIILLKYWKINLKEMLFFAVPAFLIGLVYFGWGLYLAPNLFINIFRYQGLERGFIGSINFLVSATRVGILNFPFDGWWIGGFLSLILIPFKKEYLSLSLSVLIILLTALLLGGANYPWYFIPLIPFMCLTTALFFWQVATNPTLISVLIFFLIFVSSSFYWGYGVFQADLSATNYQQPFGLYRVLLIVFTLAILWFRFSKMKRLKILWFLSIMIVLLLLFRLNERSIYFILSHWGKFPSLYTPGTF